MNILLLCAEAARHTGTVADHLTAFEKFSRHNVVVLDSFIAGEISINLDLFDVVVFHYSMVISMPSYLSKGMAKRLAEFKGVKILFIQDEYRWVDRTSTAIRKLGISVIFTVANKQAIRPIYRDPYFDTVRFEQTLTGFVPEQLLSRKVPAYEDRELDIAYRARKLPGWCGSFAQQKWLIGARVEKQSKKYGLKTDIAMSEKSRIYGEAWIDFISNAKATLGTASGASFVDYTGEVMSAIDKFEAKNPDISFEEVKERFLNGQDGDVVIDVISPRVFEAAALRTLMILYPGEYSNVIQPGHHFVELKPDHSNMDEVVSVLRDPVRAGEIIQRSYEEIACSGKWSFKTFIGHFDRVLDEEVRRYTLVGIGNSQGRKGDTQGGAVDKVSREKLQKEIQWMERQYVRKLKRKMVIQAIKIRIKTAIVKTLYVVYNFIDKKFPPALARPLLSAGRIIIRYLKLLRRNWIYNHDGSD